MDRATEALATAVEVFPRSAPAFAAGFLMRAVARRLAGADLDDVTMDAVLRALPHNVTTEMDLQLWALAQQVRADPASAAELGAADADPTSAPSPPASTPATCPRSCRTGSPRSCAATATGPSPRSTSACPAGPSSPSTCSACWPTTCG